MQKALRYQFYPDAPAAQAPLRRFPCSCLGFSSQAARSTCGPWGPQTHCEWGPRAAAFTRSLSDQYCQQQDKEKCFKTRRLWSWKHLQIGVSDTSQKGQSQAYTGHLVTKPQPRYFDNNKREENTCLISWHCKPLQKYISILYTYPSAVMLVLILCRGAEGTRVIAKSSSSKKSVCRLK